MSIILKGIDLPKKGTNIVLTIYGRDGAYDAEIYPSGVRIKGEAICIPKGHGRLIEEHYPGELQAKQPKELFIMYRSADEDSTRFMFEAEADW